MPKKNLIAKFCTYDCEYAKPLEDVPGCHSINPIYCEKYKRQTGKMRPCFDNLNTPKRSKRKKY